MNIPAFMGSALMVACLGATPVLALGSPVQEFLDRLVKQENLPGAVLLVSGPQGR